jgi:DNA-binding NtrC family response regulator
LTHYYLARYAAELGLEALPVTRDALATLRQLPWPGNVRELANTIQKALIFNRGVPLRSEDIKSAVKEYGASKSANTESRQEDLRKWVRHQVRNIESDHLFEESVDRFSALLINEALNFTDGNRSRAARLLGISRPTLHAKIDKYQLTFETSVKGPNE